MAKSCIAARVSTVAEPMCGRRIVFGAARIGEPTGTGSTSITSRAAPAMIPAVRAAARATSSTTGPREVFTTQAVGFINANSRAPSMCVFSGVRFACSETKSDSRSRSSSDRYGVASPASRKRS